ncbi:hypothetical protein K8T06_16220 [bacterium]|nr:hypothetical protein [bacterium]
MTMLEDRTPEKHRWNGMSDYWGAIRKDELGTATIYLYGRTGKFSTDITVSVNFGQAISDEDRGTFDYKGRRVDARLGFQHGIWTVQGRYLYQSGSPFPHPDEEDNYREFKGFSYYPPTNSALYDSHYFREDGPPILLGSRLTPYYGLPRPNQHNDMSAPENLKSLSVLLNLEPIPTLSISCTAWLLEADEVYWVLDGDEYFRPSSDLGWELDSEIIWKPFDHIAIKGFFGILFLGDFYRDIEPYYPSGLTQPITNGWVEEKIVSLGELGVTFWL